MPDVRSGEGGAIVIELYLPYSLVRDTLALLPDDNHPRRDVLQRLLDESEECGIGRRCCSDMTLDECEHLISAFGQAATLGHKSPGRLLSCGEKVAKAVRKHNRQTV